MWGIYLSTTSVFLSDTFTEFLVSNDVDATYNRYEIDVQNNCPTYNYQISASLGVELLTDLIQLIADLKPIVDDLMVEITLK